jgi:hypothetical protein
MSWKGVVRVAAATNSTCKASGTYSALTSRAGLKEFPARLCVRAILQNVGVKGVSRERERGY